MNRTNCTIRTVHCREQLHSQANHVNPCAPGRASPEALRPVRGRRRPRPLQVGAHLPGVVDEPIPRQDLQVGDPGRGAERVGRGMEEVIAVPAFQLGAVGRVRRARRARRGLVVTPSKGHDARLLAPHGGCRTPAGQGAGAAPCLGRQASDKPLHKETLKRLPSFKVSGLPLGPHR